MRPAKKILLVDANENSCRIRAYVLRTRGYRVTEASDAMAAEALCCAGSFDLAVIVLANYGERQLLRKVSGLGVLAIVPKVSTFQYEPVEAMLPAACSQMEFLERVRIMAMRKRGPKKHAPKAEAIDAA